MSHSQRLLVLTELFLPTKGGTAVWFAEVYRRLGGKELHIVAAEVPGAAQVDADHPNTIHRLKLRRITWLRPESLWMYVKLLGKSLSLAIRHRFTAIHAGRALPEGLVAWLVARLTRRPVVIYAHGEELTGWGNGGKYQTMRFALRHADRVIANSEFTQAELIRLGVSPDRIALIHPGVDVTQFRPGLGYDELIAGLHLGASQPILLSVGRLQRRKGFDMVIRSLPMLLEKGLDVHYVVIGIGEDWDYLAALAQEEGLEERVHLLGHVPPEDLPRWYNACAVFAMPNREIDGDTEGFGMVFVEAAACRKPAVAGLAGGTGSAVIDGTTGFRVDGARPGAVADALIKLLTEPALTAHLAENAYQRAQSTFSWERVAALTKESAAELR